MGKKPLIRKSDSLPVRGCEMGFTEPQIEDIFGKDSEELRVFHRWMFGHTMALCEGRSYNHEKREYEPACDGVSHGVIVYAYDLFRYVDCGYSRMIWD